MISTNDYGQVIKERVPVPIMLEHYGFELGRHNRIPCPIHNGKDQNFGVKDSYWHCFVCGAGGDVISFVEAYFHISFSEAVEKINEDFQLGLPIGRKPTLRQKRDLSKQIRRIEEARKQREAEEEKLRSEYDEAVRVWLFWDRVLHDFAPKKPEDLDSLRESYIYALFHIAEAESNIEEAEVKLYEFERNR